MKCIGQNSAFSVFRTLSYCTSNFSLHPVINLCAGGKITLLNLAPRDRSSGIPPASFPIAAKT